MKKIFTTTFLAFLAFNISLFAQDGKQGASTATVKNSSISFYPLNMLNDYEPSIQLAYEHRLGKEWAFELVGGVITKHSLWGYLNAEPKPNSPLNRYSGYKLRMETKKILWTNKSGKHNLYVSSEAFYTHSYSTLYSSFLFSFTGGPNYESYVVNKDVVGLNVKIGKQFMFNRFLLELYGGLGVSHHTSTHYYPDNSSKPEVNKLQDYLFREGKYVRLTLPLNMKVGYRF